MLNQKSIAMNNSRIAAAAFSCGVLGIVTVLPTSTAQDAKSPAEILEAKIAVSPNWPSDKPASPAVLPGNGLRQHDFLYAGEAKTQNIYIVRKGQIVWWYENPQSKGEISDAVLMSNGNILFAHQYGITEIAPDKSVVWNFDAPPKTEIHTARPIGKDRVLFIQNGNPAKLLVVNKRTGETERQFELTVAHPKDTHLQFRHAELTDAGTLLIAHKDMGKVCEYDETGKLVWSADFPVAPWYAVRLANGNTLTCGKGLVREINPSGKPVWELIPVQDLPDYKVTGLQTARRLPNGNTLLNNWLNQWNSTVAAETPPVQAWEVTPDKKVVWALRSWTDPNLGPATTIQLLDEPSAPENVHFGAIH
jgi:PQQ-like domain